MKPIAIALSGRVSSGKTTLAELLKSRAAADVVKTKDLIKSLVTRRTWARSELQSAGRRLDRETRGEWIATSLDSRIMSAVPLRPVVIDSVRVEEQLQALRNHGWHVIHVHLRASEKALADRFTRRSSGEVSSFEQLASGEPEKHVSRLGDIADAVIDTDRCAPDDVYTRVMARVDGRPLLGAPLVDVLVGGQYGSEGKGNIADYLAPEYDVLVRVGGPNAGHKVYREGGYTFRQLPSGTLANKNATLVIGAGAVISVDVLLREVADLSIRYDRLIIDPQAMTISADDVRHEEQGIKKLIGSTAQGIGAATARKINNRWPNSDVILAKDVPALKRYIGDSVEFFAECMSSHKKVLLEGTQGTSLSLHHGHYPHVTSRATTAAACVAEAGISGRHVRRVVVVCRSYPIRVGDTVTGATSGYMSREIDFDEIERRSGIPADELKAAEKGSVSGRPRRVSEFDWMQLRRSAVLNGATDVCLTFADYLGVDNRRAFRYEQLTDDTLRFIEEIERVAGVPVSLISTAFRERNIIDRRFW